MINILLLAAAQAMNWDAKRALANSLQVGRNQDPMTWACKDCDASNKPEFSYAVEQKSIDIKVILSRYQDCYVLSFRYTNTATNAWNDILYAIQVQDQNTCSGCKVQKAFNKMWQTIKSNITNDLIFNQNQSPRPKLIITGISLGGGLSLISWVDLRVSLKGTIDNIEIITFGAPRIGNKKWAAFINENTKGIASRYQISNDPIRNLPKCLTLLCNYGNTERQYLCYKDQAKCKRTPISTERQLTVDESGEDQQEVGSIINHINDYYLLYNYEVVQ